MFASSETIPHNSNAAIRKPKAPEPVVEESVPAPAPVVEESVPAPAPVVEETIPEEPVEVPANEDDIVLPFGDAAVVAVDEDAAPQAKVDDIPQMPLYDSDNYNNPVNAVGSEQNVSQPVDNASFYGDYAGNEAQEAVTEVPPYQPYGAETFSTADQSSFGTYGEQPVGMQGGAPMDNSGFGEGGYDQVPQGGYDDYSGAGYQAPAGRHQLLLHPH